MLRKIAASTEEDTVIESEARQRRVESGLW